jgi:hypothetical protein
MAKLDMMRQVLDNYYCRTIGWMASPLLLKVRYLIISKQRRLVILSLMVRYLSYLRYLVVNQVEEILRHLGTRCWQSIEYVLGR